MLAAGAGASGKIAPGCHGSNAAGDAIIAKLLPAALAISSLGAVDTSQSLAPATTAIELFFDNHNSWRKVA